MIFTHQDEAAPPKVKKLSDHIKQIWPKLEEKNFWAFYRRKRDCFPEGERGDRAISACYLALRYMDPCLFGFEEFCPHRGKSGDHRSHLPESERGI